MTDSENQHMNNHRWYYILGCSVFLGAAVALSGCKAVEELPPEKIAPALSRFGGIKLPKKADGLRALYSHRRDPEIFVRFQTDSGGIGYVESAFGGPDVKYRDLDAEDFRRMKEDGIHLFIGASMMEKVAGVKIHDQDSLGRGRELKREPPRFNDVGYQVYVDEQNKTVYIYAYIL